MSFDVVNSRNRHDLIQNIIQKTKKKSNSKILDINIYAKIHKNTTRHEHSYRRLEVKKNRTYFNAEIVTDITTRN
jgi:hypothetical protein